VRRLLSFGIKNAIAVEGTDVPDAIAALSRERTTTALLDGDRGGDLLLRELRQVAAVDYVAFVPEGRSVEDLDRSEVFEALRGKVPVDSLPAPEEPLPEEDATEDGDAPEGDSATPSDVPGPPATEDGTAPSEATTGTSPDGNVGSESLPRAVDAASAGKVAIEGERTAGETKDEASAGEAEDEATAGDDPGSESDADAEPPDGEASGSGAVDADDSDEDAPETLAEHVAATLDTGTVRLLGSGHVLLADHPIEDAFDAIETADPVPTTVVLDGTLTQRLLDVASQRGVGQVIARGTGEFAKQPVDVRVRLAEEFALAGA
jgi:DNA primase